MRQELITDRLKKEKLIMDNSLKSRLLIKELIGLLPLIKGLDWGHKITLQFIEGRKEVLKWKKWHQIRFQLTCSSLLAFTAFW